jgi:predicted permease
MALLSGLKRLIHRLCHEPATSTDRADPASLASTGDPGTPTDGAEAIEEELQSHLEMKARDLVEAGLSEKEARREARRRFGNVEAVRRGCLAVQTSAAREGARRDLLDSFQQDVRFALRSLRNSPGFSATAILTLGLGIGAVAAVFSVINTVVIRPLPYPEHERLVRWFELDPDGVGYMTSEPGYTEFRDQSASFMEMAAWSRSRYTVHTGGEPFEITVARGTASVFDLLGAEPMLGRIFTAAEDLPGNPGRVVVISHAVWQQGFAGDTGVLGRTLSVEEHPFTVIGVLPTGFRSPLGEGAWVPLGPDPNASRSSHWLASIGRMRPGVTMEQAQSELDMIAARLSDSYPETNQDWSVLVWSFRDWLIGADLTRRMLVLQATSGLLLLIACINVSSLLVARASTRQREIGLRAALGAGQGRLVRQLLTESMLLGLFGTALALLLAFFTVAVVRSVAGADIPRLDLVSLDATALAVTLAVSVITGLAFGLIPAVHASRGSLQQSMQRGGVMAEGRRRHLRSAMVVGEVAVAMTLLIGAALLLTSFHRLYSTDPGLDADDTLAVPLSLGAKRYDGDGQRRLAFLAEASARITMLPGVVAVGVSNIPPFEGERGNLVRELTRPGMDPASPEASILADNRAVTPGYFEVMSIPLLRGRVHDERDVQRAGPVPAVISESLARAVWGGGDPIGQEIGYGSPPSHWCQVIGVIGDVRDVTPEWDISPAIYVPFWFVAEHWSRATLLIKTAEHEEGLQAAIREQIWAVDPGLAIADVRSLAERRGATVSEPRLNTWLMGTFASLALALAAIGVYGVMAFSVARRTVEFGVRMALGARACQVKRMVLGGALKLTLFGVGLGLAGALALARFIESVLYETAPTDPLILTGVAVALCAVALVAAIIPAHRATRVDPKLAMRTE